MVIWNTVWLRLERVFQSVASTWRAACPRSSTSSTLAGEVTISSWSPESTTRPRSSRIRGCPVGPARGAAAPRRLGVLGPGAPGSASRSRSVSL